MVDTFPRRLIVLLAALALSCMVMLMRRRDDRRGLQDWRRLVPLSAFILVVVGMAASIVMELRATVWCYYTDDMSIRIEAAEAAGQVRTVLWSDPQRAATAFNDVEHAIAPQFLQKTLGVVLFG